MRAADARIKEEVERACRMESANLRPGAKGATVTEVATGVAIRIVKSEQVRLLMDLSRLNGTLDSVKLDKLITRYAAAVGYVVTGNSAMPLPRDAA